MSEERFAPTPAQHDAMYSRGNSILVSAGAGSGKTKVLTERVISYITDEKNPVNIDSFVIITFTKAAAAELRGRINEELSAKSAENPNSAHLRRQTAFLRRAHIGTIHSFCASILRENCHAAGIPSDFSILPDERAAAMKSAALERVMDRCYESISSDRDFEALVNTVGAGRDDSKLLTLVIDLYDKMQCHARPEKWAEKVTHDLEKEYADLADCPWGEVILEHERKRADYWAQELACMVQDIQSDEALSKAYMDSIRETEDGVAKLMSSLELGWNSARECPKVLFPRLGSSRGCEDEALKDKIQKKRNRCKKEIAEIERNLSADSESLQEEMRHTAPSIRALLRLTLAFEDEYSKSKRNAGCLDYSDLEHLCARLLMDEDGNSTPLAKNISARYTEIMVDEYQDVSRVQDEIFKAISDEGRKLFMVGDAKQSIYRFRLANPAIFNDKLNSYAKSSVAEPGKAKKILLRENFRSRREILNCANAVFGMCMSSDLGDIKYDEDTMLIYGAGSKYQDTVPVPEIDLFTAPEGETDAKSRRAVEAREIGKKILELVSAGGYRYKDVAILLRNSNSVGKIYSRELEKLDVPVASGAGEDFFSADEVIFVYSMLKLMDNPHMDIPLLTVLSNPAIGFTPDELSRIRMTDINSDLYTALCTLSETDEKSAAFVRLINSLRDSAPDMKAERIVWSIIDNTDIYTLCSAMKNGPQRIANLMYFIQLAESFEADGYHGLHNFVLYLQRLEAKGHEIPSLGEQDDAVHILSIHKSKGLEYPVVFLADMEHEFNKSDSKEIVVVHPELGLGPLYIDSERMVKYPTLARRAISLKLIRESLSEEMRLMYVALTRPESRLFITAALADPEKIIASVCDTMLSSSGSLHPEALAQAKSPIEWFIAASQADGGKNLKLNVMDTRNEAADITPGEHISEPVDVEVYERLKRNLSFVYPHKEAEKLPSKVTATELKHMENEADDESFSMVPARRVRFRKPELGAETKAISGSERGIATHLTLQYMNPERTGSVEEVEQEIARLREKNFLSERQTKAVNCEAIVKLFNSPLGERIRRADAVHREFRFSLLCDASELMNSAAGEEILLQGVVDCCLEENGELVIIDYKTDHISSDADLLQKKELYSSQVKAYSLALSRIFSMPVKETVLYFLSVGKEISV